MSVWSSGYVADVGYTYGYFTELNPLRTKLALLSKGLAFPEVVNACELGFGQGLSVGIHAAASPINWYGTDFNPSQTAFAQQLVSIANSGAKLADDSFDEFLRRDDLPQFDYIGLHGIWSWIDDDNRKILVEFVRKKLKAGGVLYVSYNTLPGWSAFAPLRHLLSKHGSILGAPGEGTLGRVDGAISFVENLLATNPGYARGSSEITGRLASLKTLSKQYIAHEYFNRHWLPMHFTEIAEKLEGAKIDFACSAHFLDHIEGLNLTAAQKSFLGAIPDLVLRENTRDFIVNQAFRKDYWIKGATKLNSMEILEKIRSERVVLTVPAAEIPKSVTGALGEAELQDAAYGYLLDVLSDQKPRTLEQLEKALQKNNVGFVKMQQCVMILAGMGCLAVAQDDSIAEKQKKSTDKLNRYLVNKAKGGSEIGHLASPLTGGGVEVDQVQQLFLAAFWQGKKRLDELADSAWDTIQSQGRAVVKSGVVLKSPEENIEEIRARADAFLEKRLSTLKALMIV